MRNSNYDKFPKVKVTGFDQEAWQGWDKILQELIRSVSLITNDKVIVVVETYPGVYDDELIPNIKKGLEPSHFFESRNSFLSEKALDELTYPDVTGDRIFGFMSRLTIDSYFDPDKLEELKTEIRLIEKGLIVLYGCGASRLTDHWDLMVYADMARWEIQQRMRKEEIANLGSSNFDLEIARKYKRAYFVDWRVADRLKRELIDNWDYILDTNKKDTPKMLTGQALLNGLKQTGRRPFRVVPFFDPGPWGGQWMKEVCDLDRRQENFAWCFDCVPEENSLVLEYGETEIEIPSQNLVYYQPKELLGGAVYSRFGAEFPIRFDFLDTMDGGNLSLQVHPLTEYIREHFGMPYTQDESYYMLAAGEDAVVYLGLREGMSPEAMIKELKAAQEGGPPFDADKHVEKWQVRKHDHILIPAGTVHCSGKNSMVLEISATPYIFTFKLWDWGRLGLDGKPRPINIEHGRKVIQWDRSTNWTGKNLINRIQPIAKGDGWREERTGLHELEFIETRRHWFTAKVMHDTKDGVNVLNLVEGNEAIVESPDEAFEPFIVHYAETFIVPAAVGQYTIRPYGESEGKECATLKAYVRTRN